MLSPSFPRLSLKLSAQKIPTSIISIGNHTTNVRLFSNKTNFQWKLLFGTEAKRAKPACRKQDTSVRQTVRKPRIRQPRFTSLSARLKRALYKKRLCRCLKPPDLSPRNRIAAFAQGPPPRRTACNGNETNRHGRSLLSSADFPTDRRDIRFNGNRPTMPRSRNITISDAAKIRKSCAAIRTNLNSRPIPPKSQDAKKLS